MLSYIQKYAHLRRRQHQKCQLFFLFKDITIFFVIKGTFYISRRLNRTLGDEKGASNNGLCSMQ